MSDVSEFHLDQENPNLYHLQWFGPSADIPSQVYQQYVSVLAKLHHKADVLIRANDMSPSVLSDLIDKLSAHPKVGTLLIYGLPRAEKVQMAARAVLLGVNVRFFDSEEEARIIAQKRRSLTVSPRLSDDLHMRMAQEKRRDQPRGTTH